LSLPQGTHHGPEVRDAAGRGFPAAPGAGPAAPPAPSFSPPAARPATTWVPHPCR